MTQQDILSRIKSYVNQCGCTAHAMDSGGVVIMHKTGRVAVTITAAGAVMRTEPGKGSQALFGTLGVKRLRELLSA